MVVLCGVEFLSAARVHKASRISGRDVLCAVLGLWLWCPRHLGARALWRGAAAPRGPMCAWTRVVSCAFVIIGGAAKYLHTHTWVYRTTYQHPPSPSHPAPLITIPTHLAPQSRLSLAAAPPCRLAGASTGRAGAWPCSTTCAACAPAR